MRKLAGITAAVLAGIVAWPALGQSPASTQSKSFSDRFSFGGTYAYEWTKTASSRSENFSLQGGSADVAYDLGGKRNTFAVAAKVDGLNASNHQPGLNLTEVAALGGPRLTHYFPRVRRRLPRTSLFAQAMFGYVHGFNSLFPSSAGAVTASASSFALQFGGGLNVPVWGRLGIRLVEADFVQTYLPNNGNNLQQNVQLSAGVTYRVHRD